MEIGRSRKCFTMLFDTLQAGRETQTSAVEWQAVGFKYNTCVWSPLWQRDRGCVYSRYPENKSSALKLSIPKRTRLASECLEFGLLFLLILWNSPNCFQDWPLSGAHELHHVQNIVRSLLRCISSYEMAKRPCVQSSILDTTLLTHACQLGLHTLWAFAQQPPLAQTLKF